MNCKDCGKPIHWAVNGTEGGSAWYHDDLRDIMTCPGTGMTEPAPDDIFDMLTRDDLYELHSALSRAHTRLHDRILLPNSCTPRVKVFGGVWKVTSAAMDEINETAAAVYAEIGRRNAEETAHA